jgi:hypothetical integral membrane protein (TIGR02206 family)
VDPLPLAEQFVPFGPSHGAVLVVLVAVASGLVALGRRQRGTPAQQRTTRMFAVVFAGFLLPLELYWLLPAQWGAGHSLPLQLCDLAALAAVWALWTWSRTAFALTYFWGLTLTAQAFLTPELNGPDFPALQFFMFFGMHCLVVWAAVYLTWGVGLRPDWHGYRVAVLATIVWGVVMFGFNEVAGTNYGFLNAKPEAGSLLDVLGPWPWYLLSEAVLGAVVWASITWPWARRRPRHPPPADGGGSVAGGTPANQGTPADGPHRG